MAPTQNDDTQYRLTAKAWYFLINRIEEDCFWTTGDAKYPEKDLKSMLMTFVHFEYKDDDKPRTDRVSTLFLDKKELVVEVRVEMKTDSSQIIGGRIIENVDKLVQQALDAGYLAPDPEFQGMHNQIISWKFNEDEMGNDDANPNVPALGLVRKAE